MLETGYNFDAKVPSVRTREDALIDEAKECIKNIEQIENLNFAEVYEVAAEAQEALAKYEKLAEIQQKELENNPEYLKLKNYLQETMKKCDTQKQECEYSLSKIDEIEKKIQAQLLDVENDNKIEQKIIFPIKVPEIPLPTIEEIDQEIQGKIEESSITEASFFPDMDDINPENFPTLYYIYEKVLQQENLEQN